MNKASLKTDQISTKIFHLENVMFLEGKKKKKRKMPCSRQTYVKRCHGSGTRSDLLSQRDRTVQGALTSHVIQLGSPTLHLGPPSTAKCES